MWSPQCDMSTMITFWFTNLQESFNPAGIILWNPWKIRHVEIHSWCCAWLCKFTPTWCWPRVFTRLQRVLVLTLGRHRRQEFSIIVCRRLSVWRNRSNSLSSGFSRTRWRTISFTKHLITFGGCCIYMFIMRSRSTVNSLKPRDAYMRLYTNHHWFR